MRHFLAYGHSDQATFRAAAVQQSFDFLTVPGTIASYYPDATAAFVLTSGVQYVIDPRTPLFQGPIGIPRASHFALAAWHGERVAQHLGSAQRRAPVTFDAASYDRESVRQLVDSVIEAQRSYGQRAPAIQQKLDRYRRLLATAQGRAIQATPEERRPPAFVIAPYFVTDGQDQWATVNEQILERCLALPDAESISVMIAVDSVTRLRQRMAAVPAGLAPTAFFWVHSFNERSVSGPDLRAMWSTVSDLAGARPLVNFYGGFFSICMDKIALWGFNNGLGYSESREWPELSATGAAPARYYMRPLHAYVSPALGQFITERVPAWACPCTVCDGKRVIALTYHDLKRHFALSRRWEMDLVGATAPGQLASTLVDAAQRYEADIAPMVPPGIQRLDVSYLRRWASVLRHP
jgi:hypothetical protein